MRLIFGAALVAAIFVSSPHRPPFDLGDDVTRWAQSAGAGLAGAVARAVPAQALADAALRHTLADGTFNGVAKPVDARVPHPRQAGNGPL